MGVAMATLPALPAAPLAGVVVAVLGFGIMTRAWWLFRPVNTVFCPYEERKLEASFGRRFTAYRDDARRWL